MDYWRYEKRKYPPRVHAPGTASEVQVSDKRLQVLVLGGEEVYDLFYSILVANIRCWGYEAQLLSRSQMRNPQIWQEMEGDVILYDMDGSLQVMPELDGMVSEGIFPRTPDPVFAGLGKSHTRLLMALSSRSISRHSLERMGAITLLRKPFDMRYLERYLRVFQKLLYGEVEATPGSDVAALSVFSGRVHRLLAGDGEIVEEASPVAEDTTRILLADDRAEITREICQGLMEQENPRARYEVRAVHDGLALLEHCLSWRPHCVVTDLLMPWLDGYEVIRCLVNNSLQPVPAFVVISALPQRRLPGDRLQLQDKAVLYIDKPFDIEDLLALIEQALAQ